MPSSPIGYGLPILYILHLTMGEGLTLLVVCLELPLAGFLLTALSVGEETSARSVLKKSRRCFRSICGEWDCFRCLSNTAYHARILYIGIEASAKAVIDERTEMLF